MPDIGQPRSQGDLSFILKKSFEGDLVSASRLSITDDVTESFVVKLAGTASKDTYLTKASITLSPGDQGINAECYVVRQTLLTGQTSRTITNVSLSEVWTTSVAHGFLVGDIIEIDNATTGAPDVNVPSMYVIETVPSTTTFTISFDEIINVKTSGTAILRYAKSGETILEIFKTAIAGDSNNGGLADSNDHYFDSAIGQKISATEEFLMYQLSHSITKRQLIGSGSIQGITVDTGVDPTL